MIYVEISSNRIPFFLYFSLWSVHSIFFYISHIPSIPCIPYIPSIPYIPYIPHFSFLSDSSCSLSHLAINKCMVVSNLFVGKVDVNRVSCTGIKWRWSIWLSRDSYDFELDFQRVYLVSPIPTYSNNREQDKRASTTVNYSNCQAK